MKTFELPCSIVPDTDKVIVHTTELREHLILEVLEVNRCDGNLTEEKSMALNYEATMKLIEELTKLAKGLKQ